MLNIEPEQKISTLTTFHLCWYFPSACLSAKKTNKKHTPLPGTRHGLNAVWVVACCQKYIDSHTHKSERLYTPHFHSLGSHLGVFFSFFFHAVWVSFTAVSDAVIHYQTFFSRTNSHLQTCKHPQSKDLRDVSEHIRRGEKENRCFWCSSGVCLSISVNLMLTVARSWYNGWLILGTEKIAPRTLLLFSCLTAFSVRPSAAFPPARWIERGASI